MNTNKNNQKNNNFNNLAKCYYIKNKKETKNTKIVNPNNSKF